MEEMREQERMERPQDEQKGKRGVKAEEVKKNRVLTQQYMKWLAGKI